MWEFNKKKVYLMAFMAPIIIMLGSWFANEYYPFGLKSLLTIDFNQQFIDMYLYFRKTVFTADFASLFYSFSKSLGGNMTGTWAYYMLSPFNLFYLVFPVKYASMAIFLSLLTRYGAIGLSFAYYLIKRRDGMNNPLLVIILSTVFALNGFSVSYQMVPIFYDALWLLPLVLVALEEVIDGRRPYRYIFILSLTLFIQFYMGYMICLFIVIYSCFYLACKQGEEEWEFYDIFSQLVRIGLYSILAVGLISFLFLPNVMNLLDSKGADGAKMVFDWKLQIQPLDILAKLMLGAFDNTSWPAGPNLPNIYVGTIGLLGLLSYFLTKEISRQRKWAALGVFVVFFFSICHEFTSKIWHMGQNPAGFFYRFSWIMVCFMLLLAFDGLKNWEKKSTSLAFVLCFAALWYIIVSMKTFSFLSSWQIWVSVGLLVAFACLIYQFNQKVWTWLLILAITFGELGTNAYLSQNRIVHNNAYRFQNALNVIDEAIAPIRPQQKEFYRISKTFYRSKNDPLMFRYPGLTNFSSSLEVSTRELFENLGNSGIDAAIYYYGTPLTDALFAVKYFVDNDPYTPKDTEESDKTYIFPSDVNRSEVINDNHFVSSTDRFSTYKVGQTLPIAFGINDLTAKLELKKNEPVENQNKIAQAMISNKEAFFTPVPNVTLQLDNLTKREDTARQVFYKRQDASRPGKIIFNFKVNNPQPIYLAVPKDLSTINNDTRLILNQQELKYRKKFGSTQLFNVCANQAGQNLSLEIEINRDTELNLTGLQLTSLNLDHVNALIQAKQKQGLQLEKWTNNSLKGQIKISDDSKWLYTSIPYDKGWQVKVDGKTVKTQEIWSSLLAFPISAGQHEIKMTFVPRGFYLGLVVSLVALALLFLLRYLEKEMYVTYEDSDPLW
ncbi:YfhO family protein [Vaginisenegalia massiliensis]|uniref:YfhO family protein n=1 Tax=Vaginisenegalia massiliensis TaxID=2058294 RepID=UPI000F538FFC|nr:YfhO family protein [Vaginisenegalia massiliensis]